jgi:hypothetical protein
MAWGGHTVSQAPQRVQAARNAISGSAPGGRKYFCWTIRSSVRSSIRSAHWPKLWRKKSRRSPGSRRTREI